MRRLLTFFHECNLSAQNIVDHALTVVYGDVCI
jgi:hypothetical protein